MKLLSRREIDSKKWDDCILNSPSCVLYAQSWYLDIFSPSWKAFVWEKNDYYEAVFPLPINRKFLISCVIQPLFVQQLGFFKQKDSSLTFPIEVLSKFKLYPISIYNFNVHNSTELEQIQGYSLTKRINLVLNLKEPFTLNQNRKRDLKKTNDNFELLEVTDFKSVIDLYFENTAPQLNSVKEHHKEKLYKLAAHKDSYSFILKTKNNEILSFGIFVACQKTLYYPVGGSTELGKKMGGFTRLIIEVINRLNYYDYLDFEGGSVAGLHQLYSSFGAKEVIYYQFEKNILKF